MNEQNRSTLPDYVTLGDHSYFADLMVHRWGEEKIVIGKYCSIAQQVKILAGGNHRTDQVTTFPLDTQFGKATRAMDDRSYAPSTGIEIGNDVWVGFGASIVGGVHVDDGAVIAAGAQVFSDVPAFAIAVGNPARVTKFRFDEEVIETLIRIAWWNWTDEKVATCRDQFYLPVRDFCAIHDLKFASRWHPELVR